MRGGCGCARVCGFPFLFLLLFFALDHTPSRERGGAARARRGHGARRPGGRSEAGEKREKNGTSGVHGGGYFTPHDTNNNFWILDLIFILDFYLRTQYSSTYGRPITYHLPDGRFASRGALVELFLFIPRPHSF